MKVKLLTQIGKHNAGDVLDIDSTYVMQLIRDGNAVIDDGDEKMKITHPDIIEPIVLTGGQPKKKGNPNFGKKK